jgi:anti-anti-sigma factor
MQTTPKIDRQGDHVIVSLSGSMTFRDYATADDLIETIFAEITPPPAAGPVKTLIFDLAAVTMIDSHWLGMFVRALKRAEEAGAAVVLRRAQPPVGRLLDLVQFGRVFRIET